jgi:hypothetical protein
MDFKKKFKNLLQKEVKTYYDRRLRVESSILGPTHFICVVAGVSEGAESAVALKSPPCGRRVF